MSRKNRSVLLASLLPLVLLAGVSAVGQAKEGKSAAVKQTRWSDPASWPDKKVPKAGDNVTIARDKDVVLDVSPPALNGLHIEGKLSFADKSDLELTTEWIMVHGELAIGTEAKPYKHKATITLTDNVKGEEMMGMGDRGIMLSGGTLNLHGDRTNAWTRLADTAAAGSNSIKVLNAAQWKVGDEIVLASTDFDPKQAERRTIAAISGNNITLDKNLEFMHFGKITDDVDERGEVGLLTRNIKVQASADAEQSFFGGHIMAMVTSKMFIEGVELNRMGQNLQLARYPIHWHLVGDAGKGQYIKNASIHDTYNRCVTVHGTNDVLVENNVTYNSVGHCFFLEDGIEHGNQFVHNLGILTKCHTSKPCIGTNLAAAGETRPAGGVNQQSKEVLIPSDSTVSMFWITNPDNTYRDNVAAGSEQIGFWMAFPEHPTGAFADTDISKATFTRRIQIREFKGNISHSNYDGLILDRGPSQTGTFNVGGNPYMAYANPADANSTRLEAVITDFTGYKNRNEGIWGRGEEHVFKNLKLADNAIGYTHAYPGIQPGGGSFTSRVEDSLFVGETDNIGNPRTDSEKAYGRSLPKPELADFPIRGFEYYDYLHSVVNVTFRNYQDNATRKSGALSYLMYTSFPTSSDNSVERVKFDNAKPVYFPPIERKWGNDNGASTGWRTAAIHDKDGSITGTPNSYVVNDIGMMDGIEACELKPTWNAFACKGDLGRMNVGGGGGRGPGGGGGGGFGGGGGPGGGGAPRAGGAGPGAAGPGAPAGPGGPGAVAARAPGAGPGPGPGGPAGPGAAAGPGGPGGPGGAPRAGGPGGPGGGFGGGGGAAAAPPQPPVVLSRNGKELTVNGETNVVAGTEIKVTTERPTLPISVSQLDSGSWVIFQLPGFNTAASGTQENSLDALRKASATSYFKDKDALWVKLVSTGPVAGGRGGGIGTPAGGGSSIQVSR